MDSLVSHPLFTRGSFVRADQVRELANLFARRAAAGKENLTSETLVVAEEAKTQGNRATMAIQRMADRERQFGDLLCRDHTLNGGILFSLAGYVIELQARAVEGRR